MTIVTRTMGFREVFVSVTLEWTNVLAVLRSECKLLPMLQWILTSQFVSVLDNGKVKHYRVRRGENGKYNVSKNRTFETLKELVNHYSLQEDGLCARLLQPCKGVNYYFLILLSWIYIYVWVCDNYTSWLNLLLIAFCSAPREILMRQVIA